jgi:hypothetical protein
MIESGLMVAKRRGLNLKLLVPGIIVCTLEIYDQEREKAYFGSGGKVIVRKTEHRGADRKIGSWLVAGPIGNVAIGRDKTILSL